MARKRGKHQLIESLEIVDIAAEGKAIGKHNDMVVFVPFAVVGDVVNVQINCKRRRYMEGYIVDFVERSPLRVDPFCKHYGECGGCKWQSLPYSEQLKAKHKQVSDQLSRIGKVELPEIQPILGSEATQYYRNKLEFSFSDKRWITREEQLSGEDLSDRGGALGFHISGFFDKILDIDHCYLQGEPSNRIRNAVKSFTMEHGYSYYNSRLHEGFMRGVVVRTSSTGEVMVIVIFGHRDDERAAPLLNHLKKTVPEITSLMYIINSKLNDSYGDLDVELFDGKDHIMEAMEDLKFKVGPKSFYQTNSEQAYNLYKVVREAAEITPDEIVYDLYTGTGTIANFVARGAKRVVGIEYVAEAIDDAHQNSQINGIDNTLFYAGDMKKVLNDQFIERNGHPDVIILDPPRAGIDEEVAETILRAAPKRMVYVSCNPATQARDLAILDVDYKVVSVQPVDMFPHTHHVENVVSLIRR